MKRNKYNLTTENFIEIQKYYDDGNSWVEASIFFDLPIGILRNARESGKLISKRSLSEAMNMYFKKIETKTKVCNTCRLEKDVSEFEPKSRYCNVCFIIKQREIARKSYANNRQKRLDYQKKYKSSEENRDKIKKARRKHYKKNKKKIIARLTQKRKTNINYRLSIYLRNRILAVLKGNQKSERTLNLLGCSYNYLKCHLEKQFKEGMTWENHGEWHIDHIKPCASFDLTDPEQQKLCFNYTNLQPLWAYDNLSKGAKIQGI